MFQLWCYVTPLCGAIIADQYLGKYATIKWFSLIYLSGIAVLFATSLPWSIENGAAAPGLLIAMVVIGIGTGGIKSNVGPLIAEQVRSTEPFVKSISSTKQVIVDPDLTLQRVFMVFYSAINIGSISAIATTMLELHVGFWSAFLLPMLMFCVGYAVLVSGKKRYIIKPPQGGVIGNCFRALWIAVRNNGNLDMAKPSMRGRARGNARMDWSDGFVDELKSALIACKAFLFFPVYWLCYSQITNNLVSQGTYLCWVADTAHNLTKELKSFHSWSDGTSWSSKRHITKH
jgi:dipeptide/tripeptide permease